MRSYESWLLNLTCLLASNAVLPSLLFLSLCSSPCLAHGVSGHVHIKYRISHCYYYNRNPRAVWSRSVHHAHVPLSFGMHSMIIYLPMCEGRPQKKIHSSALPADVLTVYILVSLIAHFMSELHAPLSICSRKQRTMTYRYWWEIIINSWKTNTRP